MRLLKPFAKPEESQGEWFLFATVPSSGKDRPEERVEFKVRRISKTKATEIETRHLGRKRAVHYRGEVGTVETEVEKTDHVITEKACFALVDSRGGAEVEIGDEGAAAAYTRALGRPVQVGELVSLDGQWNDAVKALVLEEYEDLAIWIVKKASSIAKKADEDEAGKGSSF